mmetsp:Transcript_24191/g.55022  ORF Transcript_24191/g.55022 Transcript_24191/m.55022 type:complete len:102 (-) Transcript_24191:1384-1689(-)
MLSNAGPGGTIYPDFVSFTVAELMKHIGVYILNRVIPPPRVEYKMSSQEKDPINGNDMVFNSLGSNGLHHHRHFKCFSAFRIQGLELPVGRPTQTGRSNPY